jgi:hypothetical protein
MARPDLSTMITTVEQSVNRPHGKGNKPVGHAARWETGAVAWRTRKTPPAFLADITRLRQ